MNGVGTSDRINSKGGLSSGQIIPIVQQVFFHLPDLCLFPGLETALENCTQEYCHYRQLENYLCTLLPFCPKEQQMHSP